MILRFHASGLMILVAPKTCYENGMSDRPTRVSHWLAVLREPGWKYFVALPFSLFAASVPTRDEFLPAEVAEKWKLPAVIKDHFPALLVAAPWYVWALLTAFVLIVLIFEGSYRVAARESDEKATLGARLNSLEYGRPQLELIFDESDLRCVKDEFTGTPMISHQKFVGGMLASRTPRQQKALMMSRLKHTILGLYRTLLRVSAVPHMDAQ